MNNQEREELVTGWIVLHFADEGEDSYEENFWAAELMSRLSFEKPLLCWEIVLRIFNRNPNDWVLCNLAAGPMEDLLSYHGAEIIDHVEKMAASDARFRWMLRGVWQNAMSDPVWERVKQCATEIS